MDSFEDERIMANVIRDMMILVIIFSGIFIGTSFMYQSLSKEYGIQQDANWNNTDFIQFDELQDSKDSIVTQLNKTDVTEGTEEDTLIGLGKRMLKFALQIVNNVFALIQATESALGLPSWFVETFMLVITVLVGFAAIKYARGVDL